MIFLDQVLRGNSQADHPFQQYANFEINAPMNVKKNDNLIQIFVKVDLYVITFRLVFTQQTNKNHDSQTTTSVFRSIKRKI